MNKPRVFCVTLYICLLSSAATAQEGAELLEQSGIQGGVVVHLGCGDATLTEQLLANDRYRVHGLDTDPDKVKAARNRLVAAGRYGAVSVDRWDGEHLPYVDNFVNLIVAAGAGAGVSEEELMRVLAPNGVLLMQREGEWQKTVKPWPAEMDDWTHYFHGPDGNPAGNDTLVAPPKRLQWLGSPGWSRHHDHMASMTSLVSANGRLFYILDEGSRASIQLPSHWQSDRPRRFQRHHPLEARYPRWASKDFGLRAARPICCGGWWRLATACMSPWASTRRPRPGRRHRRDAGDVRGQRVHARDRGRRRHGTPGRRPRAVAPARLPPRRHIRLGEHAGLEHRLGLAGRDPEHRGLRRRVGQAALENTSRPSLPARWPPTPTRSSFTTARNSSASTAAPASTRWEAEETPLKMPVHSNTGPRVLIYEDMVLLAANNGKVSGWSLDDGQKLWEQHQKPSGHMSLKDLFVVDGLVWTAAIAGSRDDGVLTGYDPEDRREVSASSRPTCSSTGSTIAAIRPRPAGRFCSPAATAPSSST